MAALAIFTGSFGQQRPGKKDFTREDYMRKNKSQKVLAIGLLIGGVGTAIGGEALTDTYASYASTWMIAGGAAMAAGSIFLFSNSARTKKKAEGTEIAFAGQDYTMAGVKGIVRSRMPVIMLRVRLH